MGPAPVVTAPLHYPTGQRQWMGALERQDWVQDIRIDGRENLLAICRELMLTTDWETLESMPGWDRLREATGLSDTTIGRWLLELRLRGWAVVVETGSTPATRPMVMATGDDHFRLNVEDGNRRAVYALRIPLSPAEAAVWVAQQIVDQARADVEDERAAQEPSAAGPVEKKGRPSWDLSRRERDQEGGFAREGRVVDKLVGQGPVWRRVKNEASALRAPGLDQKQREIWRSKVPTSGFEMLIAAAWLRREVPIFGRLTRRGVRRLCRPLWAAGWSNLDVVHALDHQPGAFDPRAGVPVGRTLAENADSRDVWRWLKARLRAWVDGDGRVLPGFYQAEQRRAAARRTVVAQHGRAGAAALGARDHVLTAEHVARFGQQVARQLRPAAERRPRPLGPVASDQTRATSRAALDQALAERQAIRSFEERLAAQAAADRAAQAAAAASILQTARARMAERQVPVAPPDEAVRAEWDALTPTERWQRVLDQQGGAGNRPVTRPRRRRRNT